jgi:phosphomannomutase
MMHLLSSLRQECTIGYVSGSDLAKQQEQLSTPAVPVMTLFDFCFAENGLVAYRLGEPLHSPSFKEHIGEGPYQQLVDWLQNYVDNILKTPFERDLFLKSAEFRHGMINVPLIQRKASFEDRNKFEKYDQEHGIRKTMVQEAKKALPDLDVTYSIGGQISIDVFPRGWDKTYCLGHVEAEKKRSGVEYTQIHFFGDMIQPGGNDHEIYEDKRTIGHAVTDPEDCMKQVKELFKL